MVLVVVANNVGKSGDYLILHRAAHICTSQMRSVVLFVFVFRHGNFLILFLFFMKPLKTGGKKKKRRPGANFNFARRSQPGLKNFNFRYHFFTAGGGGALVMMAWALSPLHSKLPLLMPHFLRAPPPNYSFLGANRFAAFVNQFSSWGKASRGVLV